MNSRVLISHCPTYDVAEINKSIDTIFSTFNAEKLFLPGQHVLIKPNLIAADHPDMASVTHPAVIESLVLKLQSMRVRPAIGDSPALGSIKGVAKVTGLDIICEKYSVPLVQLLGNENTYRYGRESVFLHSLGFRKQKLIERLSRVTVSVKEYDAIINVPKLKAHVQVGITAATKNLYGLIAGKGKVLRHFLVNNDIEMFALVLLRILERIRPELTIVDAISTMEGHGPRWGKAVQRGLLIGGRDCLAIEQALIQLIGCESSKHVIATVAQKYGCVPSDFTNIELINPDNKDLEGFQFCSETVPISFSLKRVIISCLRHLMVLIFEKKRKKEQYL